MDANCDTSRFLYCDTTITPHHLCRCNSSMFWNGDPKNKSGTCEYKRTINQYCYPYDNTWCDYAGPLGQRLTCTQYTNPYGSEYGECNENLNRKQIILFVFFFYRRMSMFTTRIL